MKMSQEDLKVLLSGMNLSGAQVNIGNDNVSQTVIVCGGEAAARTNTPASGEGQQAVSEALKNCFHGDQQQASDFVEKVRGMKSTEIVALVGRLVGRKVISDLSCHRDLWRALSDAGLYAASEQNWNKQLNQYLR